MISQAAYLYLVPRVFFSLSDGLAHGNTKKSRLTMKLSSSEYSRQRGNVLTTSQGVRSARPLIISYPPAPSLPPCRQLRLITRLSP